MSRPAAGARVLVVHADDGEWARRGETPIEARDLGLAGASGGRFGGAQLRNTGDTAYALDWHRHDNDLHFVYVLGGSFVLELEDGPEVMTAGSAAVLPALARHKEYGFSGDFAGLMITAPAVFDTIPDGGELPQRARSPEPGLRATVSHQAESAYLAGTGSFRCRDLGAGAATAGRVQMQVVRAAEGQGEVVSTPSPAQWVMVLEGEALLELGDGVVTLGAFDSVWLAEGTRRRLTATTVGFRALELHAASGAERYFEP